MIAGERSATPREYSTPVHREHERTDADARDLLLGKGDPQATADGVLDQLRSGSPRRPFTRETNVLLAALAATNPSVVTQEFGIALRDLHQHADLTTTWQPGLDAVFEMFSLLLHTPAVHVLTDIAFQTLDTPDVHPRWSRRAVHLLAEIVRWRPDLIDARQALHIAGKAPRHERNAYFVNVIEPILLPNVTTLSLDDLDCLRLSGLDPLDTRYLLAALAEHSDTPPEVAAVARRQCASMFPLRSRWSEQTGQRRLRVLCIQNIADAQGDEIVRTAPLLQAFLDSNPDTHITLITDRTYLYGHARIDTVSFDDRSRVNAHLSESPDVLIEFMETRIQHLNHDLDLADALNALRERSRITLDIRASKGSDALEFETVWFGGLEWSRALGLHVPRVESIYDPAYRLIMELGLSLRTGEMPPSSNPVLVNRSWAPADTAWRDTVRGNIDQRPVALLNPFGGASELKGFVREKYDDLMPIIHGLISEGYFVVLCPTGTPWGSEQSLQEIRAGLPPSQQHFVRIAPDPVARGHTTQTSLCGDTTAEERSAGMRTLISFVDRADLIVTVEGWTMHAAYAFGKPYRLLMLPESAGRRWQPWGQSIEQRHWMFVGDASLDRPPLPEQPRKFAWLHLLNGVSGPDWLDVIAEMCTSQDRDIRVAATSALGRTEDQAAVAILVERLEDPSSRVRGTAAAALLDHFRENTERRLTDRTHLTAHRMIGKTPPDWYAVAHLGEAATPALRAAISGDDPVIRREAAQVAEHLSRHGVAIDIYPKQPGVERKVVAAMGSLERIGMQIWQRLNRVRPRHNRAASSPTILILTPIKDAADCVESYCRLIQRLSYPHHRISLGFLESDSSDDTYDAMQHACTMLEPEFRRVRLWKRDFGYQIPGGWHRGAPQIQDERRRILARSRNYLLTSALQDEDWVLWLDADVIEYPPDIIERLLATRQNIVHPHCVLDYGGPTFDQNAWRDHGRLHMDNLRHEGDLVPLDTVGGTMLLVRADLHRDGLNFPTVPYRPGHPKARRGEGELETEGFGILASDAGETCWGTPNLEILHRRA